MTIFYNYWLVFHDNLKKMPNNRWVHGNTSHPFWRLSLSKHSLKSSTIEVALTRSHFLAPPILFDRSHKNVLLVSTVFQIFSFHIACGEGSELQVHSFERNLRADRKEVHFIYLMENKTTKTYYMAIIIIIYIYIYNYVYIYIYIYN